MTESCYRITRTRNLEQHFTRLTFFGMCKLTPSSELADMSSADREMQPYWWYPESVLEVKSSIKKRLTTKLRILLLAQNSLTIFLPSQNANGRYINAEARGEWWVTRQTWEQREEVKKNPLIRQQALKIIVEWIFYALLSLSCLPSFLRLYLLIRSEYRLGNQPLFGKWARAHPRGRIEDRKRRKSSLLRIPHFYFCLLCLCVGIKS